MISSFFKHIHVSFVYEAKLTDYNSFLEEFHTLAFNIYQSLPFYLKVATIDIFKNAKALKNLTIDSVISIKFFVRGHEVPYETVKATENLTEWLMTKMKHEIKTIQTKETAEFIVHISKTRKVVLCYGLASIKSKSQNFEKELALAHLVVGDNFPFVNIENDNLVNQFFFFEKFNNSTKAPQLFFYSEGQKFEFKGKFEFQEILAFIEDSEIAGINFLDEKSFNIYFDKTTFEGALVFLQKTHLKKYLIDPNTRELLLEVKETLNANNISLSISYNEQDSAFGKILQEEFQHPYNSTQNHLLLFALFTKGVSVKKYLYDGIMEKDEILEFINAVYSNEHPKIFKSEILEDRFVSKNLMKASRETLINETNSENKYFLLLSTSSEDIDLTFQESYKAACESFSSDTDPLCLICNALENDIDDLIENFSVPSLYYKDNKSQNWKLILSKELNNEYLLGETGLQHFLLRKSANEEKQEVEL